METVLKMMESRILLLEKESEIKDDIIKDLSAKLEQLEERGTTSKPERSEQRSWRTMERGYLSTNAIPNSISRNSCHF